MPEEPIMSIDCSERNGVKKTYLWILFITALTVSAILSTLLLARWKYISCQNYLLDIGVDISDAAYIDLVEWPVRHVRRDDGVSKIDQCTANTVKQIHADGKFLDDKAVAAICECSNLQALSLQDCVISERSIEKICSLKNLFALDLTGTSVSDRSLVTLSKMASLRKVSLYRTAVTESGVRSFCKSRPDVRVYTDSSIPAVLIRKSDYLHSE